MTEHYNTIIIGAGLSGLYAAWLLQQSKTDFIVLESRARAGGRILSVPHGDDGNTVSRFDMGPAWLWPDFQPRLMKLVRQLNLEIFRQFTTGDMLHEMPSAEIHRHGGPSSHSQSFRIAGGKQSLIDALLADIPRSSIQLNHRVQSLQQEGLTVHAIHDNKTCKYSADKIILALPPRLIRQNIHLEPPLSASVSEAWDAIPTWMSSHCKIIFIYEKPFWREQNLSGEVFSRRGPLSEIYDASPVTEEYFALTSFVGMPAEQREKSDHTQLIEACMAQLQRLFGQAAENVLDIKIKDWAQDKNTRTELDLSSSVQHPHYPDDLPRVLWNNTLFLAGTEVARQHGGYLEGALESADEALALINA